VIATNMEINDRKRRYAMALELGSERVFGKTFHLLITEVSSTVSARHVQNDGMAAAGQMPDCHPLNAPASSSDGGRQPGPLGWQASIYRRSSAGLEHAIMSIAVPMVGGMVSSTILTLLVIPAIYAIAKGWRLPRRSLATPSYHNCTICSGNL
jgi:hypothetical protein